MLEQLTIHNLALIEDIEINFHQGFNVLTGETGAGKSIILGALELLLGEKGEASLIRTGTKEAFVAATFNVNSSTEVKELLQTKEIELDDNRLLVRRTIKSSGRGSIYLQDVPTNRQLLKEVGNLLFDMHGQHEHQSLLSSERQRLLLDRFALLEESVAIYQIQYREFENLNKELDVLKGELAQTLKEEDYLKFVNQELSSANLQADEEDNIRDEVASLTQFEVIQDSLEEFNHLLRGKSEQGALALLKSGLTSLEKASSHDAKLEDLANRLNSIVLEAEDISESARDHLYSMSFSQSRLDELQSRLSLIQRLKRKYGPTIEDVIAFSEATATKLANFEASDDKIIELEDKIKKQDSILVELENRISESRKKGALKLEKMIQGRLILLGMPNVVFSISITEHPRRASGVDKIDFRFSANLGEPLKAIKEIASGGELSRVMLAIKSSLAEVDAIETLVFDEVDSGIGGEVALAVGSQLNELSKNKQVIAITHLASIAAKADSHFVVHKESDQSRTYTKIRVVEDHKRVEEIARMLSGHKSQEAALQHAKLLLEQ